MKTTLPTLTLLLILFAGCASEGPYVPSARNPSLEVENTTVILDREIANKIAVDKQKAERTSRGYLKSFSNVRNRTNYDMVLQIQTVFRDSEGFSVDDDTAWETMTLTANETRTISATSTSKKAEDYTTRIRMFR